jgi:uncharacterized membrane protein
MKHSKGRLAALSDGVFAFAATLLVVDIGTDLKLSQLDLQIPSFISFGIAFFVMMALWKLHYNFFQRTTYIDNWIIAANTLLLFTILFYLFPLKTLINSITMQKALAYDDLAQLFILYGFGFFLIFTSYTLLYWRAYKMDTQNVLRLQLRFYASHFAIFAITGLASLIIAYFKIGIGFGFPGFLYATLGITCYFNGVVFRRKHPEVFPN